jgi:uncharacterized repeat protein (TIGR01451 family)
MRRPSSRIAIGWSTCALALVVGPTWARADEPVVLRQAWSGHVGFFATGAPLAVDGPDADTTSADMLAQPANVDVGPPDVPAIGQARAAYLYWGGSIDESNCTDPGDIDDTVDFTPPGGVVTAVVADACFCSDAAAGSYDVQACRAEVTTLVGTLAGTYTVDGFAALVANGSTHNASFSIVLVYDDPVLPPRRVALYDGLLTMSIDIDAEEVITLDGLDVDDPPSGDLTWYVLEGDVGGGAGESVEVTGIPGGATLVLADAWNPPDNPMNHTITTTTPPQTDLIGVDVDRFTIDGALASTDTAVEVRYTAGMDKWWLVYDVVGVNVFEPVLSDSSSKDWVLHDDADADGVPSPGDTIRYTIHLHNTGNTDGVVALTDPIPPQAASWTLVDAGGGTDASAGDTLAVVDLLLPVGAMTDVVFDLVLDDVADGTAVSNVAEYAAEPGPIGGFLVAPLVVVSIAGAGSSGPGTDTGVATAGSGGSGGSDTGIVDESGAVGTSAASSGGSGGLGTTDVPLPPGTTTDDGAADGSTSLLPGGAADSAGCGCRSAKPRQSLPWLVLLLLVRRARPLTRPRPAAPRMRS